MQAAILIAIYVLTAVALQAFGFVVSQAVDTQWPAASTLTFVILFMCAFGMAWPIAVRIAEALIRRAGYEVETRPSTAAG
jgi:hypothetical protein